MTTKADLSHLSELYELPLQHLEAAYELMIKHGYPERMRLDHFVNGPWQQHVETISPRTAEARGFYISRMQHRAMSKFC